MAHEPEARGPSTLEAGRPVFHHQGRLLLPGQQTGSDSKLANRSYQAQPPRHQMNHSALEDPREQRQLDAGAKGGSGTFHQRSMSNAVAGVDHQAQQ